MHDDAVWHGWEGDGHFLSDRAWTAVRRWGWGTGDPEDRTTARAKHQLIAMPIN
jgi:hypothetical protein